MSGKECEFEQSFSFRPLPNTTFSFLQDKDTLALLMKWSMLGRISAQSYSFDHNFYPYSCEKFALCFFKDPRVAFSLRHGEVRFGIPFDKQVVSVSVERVPCTQVSMELFDPIYSCGILRPSGHIVKCSHDVYYDYDKLRLMLQEKNYENYFVVGKEERKEFLFCLFKHLCLGGKLCQFEDNIDPYISTTRQMYKELINVQKNPETKKIRVVSTVLKVRVYDESGQCYPGTPVEEQTFAYLIVDPFKRHATLLYHVYGVGKFTY